MRETERGRSRGSARRPSIQAKKSSDDWAVATHGDRGQPPEAVVSVRPAADNAVGF
jgi:hypothetical protein